MTHLPPHVRGLSQPSLRESEEVYRLLFESSGEAIVITDIDGNVHAANPAACRLFGRSEPELGDRAAWIDRDDPRWHDAIATRNATGRFAGALSFIRCDGTRFEADVVSNVYIDGAGRKRASSIIRDVSERNRADAQNAVEREVLEALAKGVSLREVLTLLVSGFERTYPGSRCSVLLVDGNRLRHGAAPSLPPSYVQAVDGIEFGPNVGSCGTAAHERRLVVATDIARDPRWTRAANLALAHGLRACWSVPIMADDGEVRGTFAQYYAEPRAPQPPELATIERFAHLASLAITRERAVKALRDRELQLASIIDSAMDGVVTIDADGRIVVFNASAEAMFRCAAEEAIGTSIERFIPPMPHRTHRLGLRRFGETAVGGRAIGRFDSLTGVRADGEHFPLEGSISFVQVDDQPLYTVILRDLTERRRADETRSELEERLRHAQKMEAIGTLAGGIAHDFNSIVAAIVGNVELARHALADGLVADEHLDEIRKAGERARDLVEQVLTFSQRRAPRRAPIALSDVAADAAKLVHPLLPPGVDLAIECVGSPSVQADATQLHRVLLNLATNAAHAMQGEAGTIRVRIEEVDWDDVPHGARATLAPGRHARLSVVDHGKGMDAATKARAFEPFFTTKGAGQGTGLGLAVVHGVVTAHRGTIIVDSEPGRGTCFDLYFPIANGEAAEEERVIEPVGESPARRGLRILYVDDDESLVFLATRLLRRSGFDLSTSRRAEDALERVRLEPAGFDLVISDLNMPGLSGLELARELRALAPNVPVVLTSGYLSDALRAAAHANGVREIMYKQNTVEELCAVVEAVARRWGGADRPLSTSA